MPDTRQHDEDRQPSTRRKKRPSPIRVLPPDVVPMMKEDQQQAVTAIAAMIAAWWHDHQHDPDE